MRKYAIWRYIRSKQSFKIRNLMLLYAVEALLNKKVIMQTQIMRFTSHCLNYSCVKLVLDMKMNEEVQIRMQRKCKFFI